MAYIICKFVYFMCQTLSKHFTYVNYLDAHNIPMKYPIFQMRKISQRPYH